MEPIITADVLRRMVQERTQIHHRGDITAAELRG
jgi:hypothetical protein